MLSLFKKAGAAIVGFVVGAATMLGLVIFVEKSFSGEVKSRKEPDGL